MSQHIQILRTNSAPASYVLLPGEFGLKGRILSIGPKTDSLTPGNETTVAPLRILTEDDITTLNTMVENYKNEMSQIAAGKNKAYVVADASKIDKTGKKITLTDGTVVNFSTLKVGDYVWVVATNTPDYWWDGNSMQAIEVDHPDLSGYMLTTTADGKYQTKSAMSAYLTTAAAASTYITKTVYESKVTELQNGINTKLAASLLQSIISPDSAGATNVIPWATGFNGNTYLNQWNTGTQPNPTGLNYAIDAYSALFLFWKNQSDITTWANSTVLKTSIVDNLTSTDATKILSAKQGNVLLNKISERVAISDIINVLTNTSTNRPLSAAQGKILNDKITSIENNVTDLMANIDGGIWA